MKYEKIHYENNSVADIGAYNIMQRIPHWHETDIEIVFVLKGKIIVSAVYDNFEVKAGEFVVINHEDVHFLQGCEDNVTFIIHIDLSSFQHKYAYIMYLDFMCESFNYNSTQVEYIKRLKNLFIKMIIEFSKESKKISGRINQYAAEIMDIIINHFDIANYYNDRHIHENQLQRYYRIMKNISENYEEKISMEIIAQEEFISKNYMSQFFKKMVGINFTDYLNSRRTEIAQKLLLATDLNLQEISLKSGFSDAKYFYKNFKKWYGSTPYEHKKKCENLVNRIGDNFEKYSKEAVFEKFNAALINLLVDEEGDVIETSDIRNPNWRQKFEKVINSLGRRRIKREIIKENQRILGMKEIFIPLFDRHVVNISDGEITLDWNFIGDVIRYAKEMNYIICIDINYADRTFKEWLAVVVNFVSFVSGVMGKEYLSRFRFYIFLTDICADGEVEELVGRMSEIIDPKNIKVAARYK